jgi:ribonucleotide monophosphatase NagD (HAD superfamily)
VLAIGDGLPTDVAGAHAQGIDCLFIAGGIHGAETLGAEGQVILPAVKALLADAGLGAAYVASHLSW